MLGGVVKLQTLGNATGLSRRKRLVEGRHPMRVQVVEHQPDHRDVGIAIVHQPLHLMGEVLHGALLGNGHMATSRLLLADEIQVARSLSFWYS